MRRLVNAWGAHMDGLLHGDTFDLMLGLAEIAAITLALMVAGTIGLGLLVTRLDAGHGSCEIQHRVGKSYVCDIYYPDPVTTP